MDRACGFQFVLTVAVVAALSAAAGAQSRKAPAGFDHRHKGIAAGKVHTVEYDSKSVGVKRKLVIYTPPVGSISRS